MRTFRIVTQVGETPARTEHGTATRGALLIGKLGQSLAEALGRVKKNERVVITLVISESDQTNQSA